MLPSNSDYLTIAKNLQAFIKDSYIKNGKPIPKKIGRGLLSYTGGFSKVFPLQVGYEKVALRFWTKEIGDSKERYKEIDDYLKKKNLPYFVGFHYIEDKLVWQGAKYPFIYMDWIEGLSLKKYIKENISDSHKIKKLAEQFLNMVKVLHQNSIAHGDLQDENILVISNGQDIELKLIDYDSLYVPKLKNFTIDVIGVEAYQHPKKNDIKKLNDKIDYFSELVIYLSLLAYAEDSTLLNPSTEKQLLFNERDFNNPLNSKILKQLQTKKYSSLINLLAKKLIEYCQETSILRLSPLENLIPIKFSDKDIERAFQTYVDLSQEDTKEIFDEISTFWNDNQDKVNTKGKILKYLYFLSNRDEYLLPTDYQELVDDKTFSFIENIYYFYTIEELDNLGKKISIDNLVDLAKKGSFEEQKKIQELYYLNKRYLPKDFFIELKNNFFKTLADMHLFVHKDILEKTLRKSELSEDESNVHIKKLQESNHIEYKIKYDDIVNDITNQYILPTDYQELIIDKSPSVNYIISSFYTVKEVEKIGEKVSVNNLVDLVKRGTFKEQKTIEKLNYVEERYIPIDFNRALEKNLFKTIETIDTYIKKDDLNRRLAKSKLSPSERKQQIVKLQNTTVERYFKTLDKVEHEIDKDPRVEKMYLELKFTKYSKTVRQYLDKFLKKYYLKKDDYKIVEFLDSQIKRRKKSMVLYLLVNFCLIFGVFVFPYKFEWLFPALSLSTTLLYILKINRLNKIPKKFQLKITGKIKPIDIKVFSKKIWVIDIILVCIVSALIYYAPLLYQDYFHLLNEII